MKRVISGVVLAAMLLVFNDSSIAQTKKYGPGVTDSEITIGQTMPYSGFASAYRIIGETELAYFAMLNEKGGVNGRKIKLLSLDDGYSPPKTLEQTRKLVEQDNVALIFGTVGTPTNLAIYRYLNEKKVPHLLLPGAASKFNDPKNFPWTTTLAPSYRMEGRVFAKYIVKVKPNAKIGILSQNDDAGKDFVAGFREGLGARADAMIVRQVTYDSTDVSVNSQILELQGAGADTFFNMSTSKFAAQAIRKAAELGWKPLQLLVSFSTSVKAVLEPAGLENAVGIVSSSITKSPDDEAWTNDKDMQDYVAFVKKYLPRASTSDSNVVLGYLAASMMTKILNEAGDDLTRENILKHATNQAQTSLPLLLPGVTVQTSPTNYDPYRTLRLQRFDGKKWTLLDTIISD